MKTFQRISSIRSQKQALRQKLSKHASKLAPGTWWLQDTTIARRMFDGPVPQAVAATKATSRRGRNRMLIWLRRILIMFMSPRLCRVTAGGVAGYSSGAVSGNTLAVLSKSGKLLIFDRLTRRVLHAYDEIAWDSEWVRTRSILGKHLPTPEFVVSESDRVICEEWVGGQSLASAGESSRTKVFNELREKLQGVYAECGRPVTESTLLHHTHGWEDLPLPAEAHRYLTGLWPPIRRRISELGVMPAHGDLSGDNVLVGPSGWRVIDLEDCSVMPAFYDLFFLAHQERIAGRGDIWNELFSEPARYRSIMFGVLSAKAQLSLAEWAAAMFVVACCSWNRKVDARRLDDVALAAWWKPVGELVCRRSVK